jgi:hypothetical protein
MGLRHGRKYHKVSLDLRSDRVELLHAAVEPGVKKTGQFAGLKVP